MVSPMERPFRFLTVNIVLLLLISSLALGGLGVMHQSPVGEARAADYSFSVEREEVNVTVLRDGSVDIDYYFLFTNVGFLDGVDIGLPNYHYDPSTADARIVVNNVEYSPSQIRESPYVETGMAVEFDNSLQNIISNAGDFELYFHINNPHMVYENELVNDTVGVSFRPTWFDPEFQVGPTVTLVQRLIFRGLPMVHLPSGTNPTPRTSSTGTMRQKARGRVDRLNVNPNDGPPGTSTWG